MGLGILMPMATGALERPVPEPDGHITPNLGEVAFGLPALCERAPFVTVRTQGAIGQPAFETAPIPSRIANIETRSEPRLRIHDRVPGSILRVGRPL
jgi:hypothetical protein